MKRTALNPELTEAGYYVESVVCILTAWGAYEITVRYLEPGRPFHKALRLCRLTYSLVNGRLECQALSKAKRAVEPLRFICAAVENTAPGSFFSKSEMSMFKSTALQEILPNKHAGSPLPEIFYAENAIPALYRLRQSKCDADTWDDEWNEMSLEEISVELVAMALAA